jgi:hypothetical protein
MKFKAGIYFILITVARTFYIDYTYQKNRAKNICLNEKSAAPISGNFGEMVYEDDGQNPLLQCFIPAFVAEATSAE